MATTTIGSGATITKSGTGTLELGSVTLSALETMVRSKIPKYSTINSVTLKAFIRETTNKVGSADFWVDFADRSNTFLQSSIHYYGNGVIPKNGSAFKEISKDLGSFTTKSGANSGEISCSGAEKILCKAKSSIVSRTYENYINVVFDLTAPTLTISATAKTGGTVSGDTGTHTVSTSDQTKQITATPSSGYKFVKWVDGNGKEYTDKTISITFSDADISAHTTTVTYTAYFELDKINKIYIGTSQPKDIYIGTQKVKAVYIGTTKVYG
jgi:hypothetical protein